VCNNLAALPTGAQRRSFFLGNFGAARLVCGGTRNDRALTPQNGRKRRDKNKKTCTSCAASVAAQVLPAVFVAVDKSLLTGTKTRKRQQAQALRLGMSLGG